VGIHVLDRWSKIAKIRQIEKGKGYQNGSRLAFPSENHSTDTTALWLASGKIASTRYVSKRDAPISMIAGEEGLRLS
jgi:hypothetical protein